MVFFSFFFFTKFKKIIAMKNSKNYLLFMLTFLVFVNSLFSQDIKQFDKDSKYMFGKVIIRFADNFNFELKDNKTKKKV